MKLIALTIFSFLFTCLSTKAQNADTTSKQNISINGVCLCSTPLSKISQLAPDLKETDVEEMDLPKNCYGQDSRFVNGKGYYSEKFLGMIFQKDKNSEYISKIRLTKKFKGKLPDGKEIDMNGFLLKDLFKIYPQFKDKWGSRGCSSYWNFSNDTISFFVKIDANKKPQFPIDEKFYADKPIEAIDIALSCYKPSSDYHVMEINTDPVFFIDSVRVNKAILEKYDPSEIASLTVYKDANAIRLVGADGKNGLVYIETKKFAKHRYWGYFKSKSKEYGRLFPTSESDLKTVYILNKKVLTDNYEADLAVVNDKTFISLEIIDKQQLEKLYGIKDNEYGVIILSSVPANQKNGKSKL